MPKKQPKSAERTIEAGRLRPVFASDTPREYANHVIVGSTGLDFSFAFGQLSTYPGFVGFTPPNKDEPGSFNVTLVVTVPATFVPGFAEVLLRQMAKTGVDLEPLIARVMASEEVAALPKK